MNLIQVGRILSQERKKQSLTLKDISEQTCIRLYRLKQIEEGCQDKSVAEVYTRGFIKAYAQALNMDIQKLFQLLGASENSKEKLKLTEVKNVDKELNPLLTIVNMGFTLTILIFTGLIFWMRATLTQYELKLSENSIQQMNQSPMEAVAWPLTDKILMDFTGHAKNINVQKKRGLSSILSIESFLQPEEESKKQKPKTKFNKTSTFTINNNS